MRHLRIFTFIGLIAIELSSVLVGCSFQASSPIPAPPSSPKVIYQKDSREDVTLSGPHEAVARATAMLVESRLLTPDGDGWLPLTTPLKDVFPLCSDEAFLEQGTLGHCTGVLIAANRVLTAGHCMASRKSCEQTLLVFGWNQAKSNLPEIPANEVYRCRRILAMSDSNRGDYAVIELDRGVREARPLSIAADESLEPLTKGRRLLSFSHPLGLPLKKDLGVVLENDVKMAFFNVAVDTFAGSSGSPLVNDRGELIGILSSGMDDVLEDDIHRVRNEGGCLRFNRCRSNFCQGERYFKINSLPIPLNEIR